MSFMHLFTLEHGKLAYRADFVFYGGASLALAGLLLTMGPHELRFQLAAFSFLGLVGWTLVEYGLHRFALHHLPPFSTWHAEHHRRPMALISTPTLLSAALIASLVFLPALALGGLWRACALTFGMVTGYFAYSVVHHASHHWRASNAWMKQRKHCHALHHSPAAPPGYYGVTSAFWDHVFESDKR